MLRQKFDPVYRVFRIGEGTIQYWDAADLTEESMPFDGRLHEGQIEALVKIDQVIDLLATPDLWCKGSLYLPDGRRCLVGAMEKVQAVRILRQPILNAIHEVSGTRYHHIEKFNDARSTTHPLLMSVLLKARENIQLEFGQHPNVIAPVRHVSWHRLRSLVFCW
jgi:hypothetical protein